MVLLEMNKYKAFYYDEIMKELGLFNTLGIHTIEYT